MKKFTRIFSLALAVLMLTGIAATATAEPISFWHTYCGSDAKTETMSEMLAKFREENPDVELEIEEVNAAMDSMGTRITTALAAHDLPDMYMYWGGFTLEAVINQDLLMNVQEYLDASENVKYEDIDAAAWAFYTIDGTLRGYPYEGAIPVWLCNSEIFEQYNLEYPKTMDDVKELAKTFSENGIITLAIGSSGGNPGHFFVSDLINQIPGGMEEIQNFGSTAQFATDASLKAAQTILDLREAGVFPQDTVANGDWTPTGELYNSGKAAMVFTYNWVVTTFDEELLEKSVIIDTPKIDDTCIDPSTFVQTSANYGFVVSKAAWENPEKRDGIIKLIDAMYNKEFYQKCVDDGVVSVMTDVASSEGIMKRIDEFYAGRTHVPAHFNTTWYRSAWQIFLTSCDELFAGNVTAEEFVNNIQDAYDEAVADAE